MNLSERWVVDEPRRPGAQARGAEREEHDAAWNVAQLPVGLGQPGEVDHLFIASDRKWRGYFLLRKEALWSPEDRRAPFTILFDTRTWKEIAPLSVARFPRHPSTDRSRDRLPPTAR